MRDRDLNGNFAAFNNSPEEVQGCLFFVVQLFYACFNILFSALVFIAFRPDLFPAPLRIAQNVYHE